MKTLILDVDGVIRDILPAILECYNKTVPFPVMAKDLKQYDLDFIKDKKAFFVQNGERIFRNSPMFSETKYALEILMDDFDITFISSQYEENEGYTLDWFENHGLPTKNLVFAWNKSKFTADYFIDDCPDNLRTNKSENRNLFDACYNRDCKDFNRIFSLYHFLYDYRGLEW